jgi:hypothetical protein
MPTPIRNNSTLFHQLAATYKQINAPVGQFGLGTLALSNSAIVSNDTGDTTYTNGESNLANLGSQRDSIASQMKQILQDAAFNGKAIDPVNANNLIQQAQQLLQQVQ